MNLTPAEIDRIITHVKQVQAMIEVISCDGLTHFDSFNDRIKNTYLTACCDGLDRIINIVDSTVER